MWWKCTLPVKFIIDVVTLCITPCMPGTYGTVLWPRFVQC